MSLDDLPGHVWPGGLITHVEDEGCDTCSGHVVDNDVGFGGKTFEEIGQLVCLGYFAAVIGAATRPKKQVAPCVSQSAQAFGCAGQEAAIRVDQCEIDIDEDVCVFH